MKMIKRLFCKEVIFDYRVSYIDDGDSIFVFSDDLNNIYHVDLDWSRNCIDIEFRLPYNDNVLDTTNANDQYKVLRTVVSIIKKMVRDINMNNPVKINTISFSTSNIKNGVIDEHSSVVRTNFFIRYVLRQYPNSKISSYDGFTKVKLIK